jgi:hypothetical protein
LQLLSAVAQRARPYLDELHAPQTSSDAPVPAGFTAPDPENTRILWASVWAHLHHGSAVAAPAMQLLSLQTTADCTLRAAALSLLEALVGVPFELVLLEEVAWAYPLSGALSTSAWNARLLCIEGMETFNKISLLMLTPEGLRTESCITVSDQMIIRG